ncbi:DEAD/DEAH box helicase [Synechococcus sp. CS-602]|uniref:DEAD/DEAH box helicase n=1 Tax=Synechococcus sp. CS-602 TaxID=2847982 RepID=UPI00223AF6D5|nr:DEAD/DEAH box helicase [Synechococcus sp. CS-602]MCT0203828.1 DEAD/DEAH box helicase [Synechococcus sp. CS-602]
MLFEYAGHQRALLRTVEDFGFVTYDLVGIPRRLCEVDSLPPLVETNVDKRRAKQLPTPAVELARLELADGDGWLSLSARTLARVYSAFLIAEDPQRRLDARKAATLMHQVSLVQHILQHPELKKVLIGDEVGLGKTIEAGLIIRQLLERDSRIRILYLAPARLVSNVAREFREKLDIDARVWVAGSASDARIDDDRVIIASIHKAVFGDNLERVVKSGPWEVIIVDECHHLSDWSPSGGKPNQSFKLVSQLIKGQPEEGRLILMSGTPHQGSEARFRNILRLLSDDGKDIKGAAGRVIFRTKDRVRDWRGAPLFPSRDIRKPVVVELGKQYEDWYSLVGQLYDIDGLKGVRLRAAGWAKGQALQWAASSVQAGLGFLIRLAIRRLNWTLQNPSLSAALVALRPYRGAARDEPLPDLFDRLVKQIGSTALQQIGEEDEEDLDEEEWRPDPKLLAELLDEGVELIQSGSCQAKWDAVCDLIDRFEDDKVVLFAQPVETVSVVAAVLEQRYGIKPAIIIGNQPDHERTAQVARFQSDDGPRFLVSSKAGGEGLNMQRARYLIHLDVPWNPMDLEQRIGRVHRFGSRKTIVVDTVVAAGSREIDMYRIARDKLALVARQLDPAQFETLFSRVMSLVPPKELEAILGDVSGPLDLGSPDAEEIGRLVNEGFRTWSSFDDAYRHQAELIRAANPGEALWADLGAFLVKYCGATDGPGATFSSFVFSNDEIVAVEENVMTIQANGNVYACGDTGGLTATGADGGLAANLGLNLDWVQRSLREVLTPNRSAGIAFVNLSPNLEMDVKGRDVLTALFLLRQQLRHEAGRWTESSVELRLYMVGAETAPVEVAGEARARLVRALNSSSRVKDPQSVSTRADLPDIEQELISILRIPSEEEIAQGVRYAIWPLAAVAIVP